MKRAPIIITLIVVVASLISCNDDEGTWETYRAWREANLAYVAEKASEVDEEGNKLYEPIVPDWDYGGFILFRKFVSGTGEYKPLYTSTVSLKYKGSLYDGTAFDSTYLYTDSISTFALTSTIQGFIMGVTNMVVGDSCEIIIPYYMGYGESSSGTIDPYSTLVFAIKLVDIPGYEQQVIP